MGPHFRYTSGDRSPVEVLVFETAPEHVEEFLTVDHEVWTLGEARVEHEGRIPFLHKEVWLDDAHPGRIMLVFVWESLEAWQRVGAVDVQERLQAEFDTRFPHPVRLLAALHEDSSFGIHRVSRFERVEGAG